jgi:hypothetical protein
MRTPMRPAVRWYAEAPTIAVTWRAYAYSGQG